MNYRSNEPTGAASHSRYEAGRKTEPEWATIYTRDIRQPWKSAYGFPMAAARLATGRPLELNCREDEVFDYVRQLNGLLESPESLGRVCSMLRKLAQETLRKLVHLLELQDQPLSKDEIPILIAKIEESLSGSAAPSVADRLACILSPDNSFQEIAGLNRMLVRLQRLSAVMESVKMTGFHVVVSDRQRQPLRPALEARRYDPILVDGKTRGVCAGFLLPVAHHLTLWRYLVVRRDKGQAAVWN